MSSQKLIQFFKNSNLVSAKTAEEIAKEHGYNCEVVMSVIRMIERSEYKRQQAAPVLKISQKAFGTGRRFPIAAKYEGEC